MRQYIDSIIAGFLVLFLPGCAGTAARNSKTVDAMRYEIKVAKSALDYVHGATRWISELYVKELGISGNLFWEPGGSKEDPFRLVPRLSVFRPNSDRYSSQDFAGEPSVRRRETVQLPESLVDDMQRLLNLRESIIKRILELELLPKEH